MAVSRRVKTVAARPPFLTPRTNVQPASRLQSVAFGNLRTAGKAGSPHRLQFPRRAPTGRIDCAGTIGTPCGVPTIRRDRPSRFDRDITAGYHGVDFLLEISRNARYLQTGRRLVSGVRRLCRCIAAHPLSRLRLSGAGRPSASVSCPFRPHDPPSCEAVTCPFGDVTCHDSNCPRSIPWFRNPPSARSSPNRPRAVLPCAAWRRIPVRGR